MVGVMEQIKNEYKAVPLRIQVDNGSEFISKALDKWAYDNKVTLDFSRPGKPTDNADESSLIHLNPSMVVLEMSV